DANGGTHISYYDLTQGDLRYAYRASSSLGPFSITVVDSAGDVGRWTSIAVDGLGTVYLAYYDATNGVLKLATKSQGGSWATQTVDHTDADVGLMCSLTLVGSEVHITYSDFTNGDLKYATKVSTSSGGGGGGGGHMVGY